MARKTAKVRTQASIVRITISVPKAVRERMRKYDATTNWSAVATAAYIRRMNLLEGEGRPTSIEERVTILECLLGLTEESR